jgi:hypothetical protein
MTTAVASPAFVVSETTAKLLKNFSNIQNSVLLHPGKNQTTVAQGKSLFAVAQFPDEWPEETGIYDLPKFLGTLSLTSKPQIIFNTDKNVMRVVTAEGKADYRMSDPTTILIPPADEPGNKLKTTNPGVTLSLSGQQLTSLIKAAGVLGLVSPTGLATVTVENGSVNIRVWDEKNPSAHTYETDLAAKDVVLFDKDFTKTIHFRTEYLTMLMDGGYKLSLASWKYGYFEHQTEPIQYFVVGQTIK